ncbi:MAG: hypothetical protein QOE70_1843 [Chthoniobacter sp.]|jgi:hypothetical protein|nr:hypothetical protein [Chthoniobacter sp.]
MKYFVHISLCLWLLLLILPGTSGASESIYDQKSARPLTPAEAAMFGPQAGKYRYDNRMIRAAQIAQSRAKAHSTSCCWRYVKTALLAAGVVDSYPKTAYAKQAAKELPQSYGFKKLSIRDPNRAPVGSVLVYGGNDAGHVEIRTARGYVSDFSSPTPYARPLIGVYVKPQT